MEIVVAKMKAKVPTNKTGMPALKKLAPKDLAKAEKKPGVLGKRARLSKKQM